MKRSLLFTRTFAVVFLIIICTGAGLEVSAQYNYGTGLITGAGNLAPFGSAGGTGVTVRTSTNSITVTANVNMNTNNSDSGIYNFDSLTINSGVTVTVTGGVNALRIRCTGAFINNGTLTAAGANGSATTGGGSTTNDWGSPNPSCSTTASLPGGAAGTGGGGWGTAGGTGGVGGGNALSGYTSGSTPKGGSATNFSGGGATGVTGAGLGGKPYTPVIAGSGGSYGTAGGSSSGTSGGTFTVPGAVYGGTTAILGGPEYDGIKGLWGGCGGGGGGGRFTSCVALTSAGGSGAGGGGGAIRVTATNIFLGSGSLISVRGGNGGGNRASSSIGTGAGGAGSGGTVNLQYASISPGSGSLGSSVNGSATTTATGVNTSSTFVAGSYIDIAGGAGGNCGSGFTVGGAGGQGRYLAETVACSPATVVADAGGSSGTYSSYNGVSVALTVGSVSGCSGTMTYTWSNDGGSHYWDNSNSSFDLTTASYGAYGSINVTPPNSATTTYTLYGLCSSGTCTGTSTVAVTTTSCPANTVSAKANSSNPLSTGNGTSVTLSSGEAGSGCTGTSQYTWYDGAHYWDGSNSTFDLSSATYSSSYTSITITPPSSATTTYTVYSQCSNNTSCSNTSSVAVTMSCTAPTITALANNTATSYSVCNGVAVPLSTSSSGGSGCAGGSFQYLWSNGGASSYWNGSTFSATTATATYLTSSTTLTGITPTASSATTYTATVQCSTAPTCANTSNVTVTAASQTFDYGTGAEGAFNPSSSQNLTGTHNYTVVNIPSGVTITAAGNAPLIIKCTGVATINGTITAAGGTGGSATGYVSGDGYAPGGAGGVGGGGGWGGAGGAGGNGVVTGSGGSGSNGTSFTGFSGEGYGGTPYSSESGGTGGSYGTQGAIATDCGAGCGVQNTTLGSTYGSSTLTTSGTQNSITTTLLGGSGGGGGGAHDQSIAANALGGDGGGGGGGAIRVTAYSIAIGSTGLISVRGGNARSLAASFYGAGGGGSGGTLNLQYAQTLTYNGSSTINGSGGTDVTTGINFVGGIGGNNGLGTYTVGGAGGQGRYYAQLDPNSCNICAAPALTAEANGTATSLTVCPGTVALSANPASGWLGCTGGTFQYTWFDGAHYWDATTSAFDLSSAVYNNSYSSINVTPQTSSSQQTITYTASGECSINTGCTSSSFVAVTVNPAPVVYNVTPASICGSGAIGLSNSGSSSISYQLVRGGSTNVGSPVTGSNAAFNFPSQSTVGTYTVVATNSSTSCTATMSGNSVLNASPTIHNLTGSATCGPVTVGLDGSDGSSISYQLVGNGSTNVGSAITGTGGALSFGSQSTAGTYTIIATNTSTSCAATMNGSTVVSSAANQWVGSISSDWFTAGNWSCNVTPGTGTDVVIPIVSGGNFSPQIGGGAPEGTATAHQLTINSGASLTVASLNGALEVYSDFINNSTSTSFLGQVSAKGSTAQTLYGANTFTNLLINNSAGVTISAAGSVAVSGTLTLQSGTLTTNGNLTITSNAGGTGEIDNFSGSNSGTISGNLTVQRYVVNPTPSHTTGLSYYYIGTPVSGATISQWSGEYSNTPMNGATDGSAVVPTASCSDVNLTIGSPYGGLFDYRENTVTSCNLAGWHTRFSGTIPVGQGFAGTVPNGTTLALTGTFNTGNISSPALTVTATNETETPGFGWNLIANPYAAPIVWSEVASANSHISGTAYTYITSGVSAGTYNPFNHLNDGELGSSEAFWVEATTNNATLNFTNSMETDGTNSFLRTAPEWEQLLSLNVSGNGFNDIAKIAFGNNFTDGFDQGYDAHKLMGRSVQPNVYVTDKVAKYCIYAIPTLTQNEKDIPVSFTAGTSGQFSFNVDLNGFDPTSLVFLEDLQQHAIQNLMANSTYSFTANASDDPARFVLHFVPAVVVTTTDAGCNGNDGTVQIDLGKYDVDNSAITWNGYTLKDNSGNVVSLGNKVNGNLTIGNLTRGSYELQLTLGTYVATKEISVTGATPVFAKFATTGSKVSAGTAVQFTNMTTGASTYDWSFGDGSTSELQNPTHSYNNQGTYHVALTADNSDCSDSYEQTITVEDLATGISDPNAASVNISGYANTVNIEFHQFTNLDELTLNIYDLTGRKIIKTQQLSTGDNRHLITVDNIVSGYYFVVLTGRDYEKAGKVFLINEQ